MVTQTAYGRWLASVLRGEFGRLNDGGTGLDLLREAAPRTLPRLGLVPVLAALIAAAFAASIWKAAPTLSLPLLLAGLGLAGVPMLALLLHQQAAGAGVLVVLLGLSQGTALGLSAASRSRSSKPSKRSGCAERRSSRSRCPAPPCRSSRARSSEANVPSACPD